MPNDELQKFKEKIDGLILAFLCQAVIIAFAAGGTWAQVAQHEARHNENDIEHKEFVVKFDKAKDEHTAMNIRLNSIERKAY